MIIYKCTKGIKRLIEKRKAFYNPDTQDHQPGMFTCDHECHDVFGYKHRITPEAYSITV